MRETPVGKLFQPDIAEAAVYVVLGRFLRSVDHDFGFQIAGFRLERDGGEAHDAVFQIHVQPQRLQGKRPRLNAVGAEIDPGVDGANTGEVQRGIRDQAVAGGVAGIDFFLQRVRLSTDAAGRADDDAQIVQFQIRGLQVGDNQRTVTAQPDLEIAAQIAVAHDAVNALQSPDILAGGEFAI